MIRVCAVYCDGSFKDEWFPTESLDELKDEFRAMPTVLLYAVEIEDRTGHILFKRSIKDEFNDRLQSRT